MRRSPHNRTERNDTSRLMAADQIPNRDFLARHSLFRDMGKAELDRIAEGTRRISAPRGEVLFNKGEPCLGFHIVIYGQVKLAFTSPQGAEKVVEIIGPGMSFGEAIMFMELPYVVYAQAIADSLLLYVGKEVVFAEIDRDPGFARRMIAGLCRRLHGLVSDLEAYTLQTATQRVIGYLLSADAGKGESNQASFTLPASKVLIASRLNLTAEHFSRVLHDLTSRGLIVVDGRSVTIPDLSELRDFGFSTGTGG
jgi:CRP-like cAMP-binding protein